MSAPRAVLRSIERNIIVAALALFALASRLAERGSHTDYLLGAESADRVFGALTARRTGRSAIIATADGERSPEVEREVRDEIGATLPAAGAPHP